MKAKKYLWSIICVYFCYLTHGIQAIILSQNNVNFAKQWGFNMSDPQSAAYAAGLAAVSTAVAWTGFGKFVSVWIGGEISDRVGRKKLRFCIWSCNFRILGCFRIPCSTGSLSGSTWISACRNQILRFTVRYGISTSGST